ncbi:hypothetical protein Talka_01862 [Tepidimonas alkaliphilus]|uniref:TonB C-terminal domain-containing protein n=1 Tax=Tepidimonas alkaliphilus TaxID=2588942 RepID=A0A554W5I8_9BURK|nr:hypothetical protein [Tepidimonas alkaliphilus]TSE18833.1 hypothetical protein Talka_01862 [Tepidimonas alkaliphilus]
MSASLRWIAASAALALTSWLAGCSTAPKPVVTETPAPAPELAPAAVAPPAPPPAAAPAPEPPWTGKVSLAASEREYRRDGASHLYERYAERIYRGKLPPLLQAVGVMRVTIGARGEVQRFEWMRAPDHVPHIKAEIERMVLAAAPYPAPQRLGSVVYTDSWLWDKSGRFQLDTLTEGQLDRLPTATPAAVPKPAARPPAARPRTASRPASRSSRAVAQDSVAQPAAR